jgi:hypothetical protein
MTSPHYQQAKYRIKHRMELTDYNNKGTSQIQDVLVTKPRKYKPITSK